MALNLLLQNHLRRKEGDGHHKKDFILYSATKTNDVVIGCKLISIRGGIPRSVTKCRIPAKCWPLPRVGLQKTKTPRKRLCSSPLPHCQRHSARNPGRDLLTAAKRSHQRARRPWRVEYFRIAQAKVAALDFIRTVRTKDE